MTDDNNMIMLVSYYNCVCPNCLFVMDKHDTTKEGFQPTFLGTPSKFKDFLHELPLVDRLGEHSCAVC